MKIEMPKQNLHLDVDITKDYNILWHTDEDGNRVDDLTITPVKGSIDITCDIELDTGDLKVTDILDVMRAFSKIQRAIRKKSRADFAARYDDNGNYVCHKLH